MTIIPFNKHGRPWSDHGQLMVISWSTMVNDHDRPWSNHGRPWSNHGRPWSDHDPAARVIFDTMTYYRSPEYQISFPLFKVSKP